MRPLLMVKVFVTALAKLEKSRLGTHCTFIVIVWLDDVMELESNTAVSCGNGIDAPDAPPDEVDHLAVLLKDPPLPTQYLVTPAGNVMPEFPPTSPALVVAKGAAAPAPVMSWKNMLVTETTAAVKVLAVPNTELRMNPMLVELELVMVSVPVTTWFAPTCIRPALLPVIVKVANVLAPVRSNDPPAPAVRLTTL